MLRSAIVGGLKTVKWGEENIRAVASEIINNDKVEAVGSTLSGVRNEVVGVAGRELAKYLDKLNLTDELVKVLTAISFEVRTEIRFIPNDQKLVTPDIKASIHAKRADDGKSKKRSDKKKAAE